MNHSSDNKRIAKNTIFLYLRMIVVLVVNLYTSRVILATLGIEDFGIYNVIAGFVSMFAFLNTSLTGAIQRYYNYENSLETEDGICNVYITSLFIQFGLGLLVVILLESFGLWYIYNVMVIPLERFHAAVYIFHFAVLALFFVIIQVPYSAAIISFERMNYYAYVGIIDVVLKLIIVLLLPCISYDRLIIYGSFIFIVSILDFLLFYIYAKRHFSRLKFSWKFDKSLFKSMIVFSSWNVFGTFSNVIYAQGLNILLNFFFGPILNAARGISYQIMTALHGFSYNVVVAFRPQLIESYAKNDFVRTRQIMFEEAKISYLLIYLLILPIILKIDDILHVWLGNNIPEYTNIFTILILINMLITSCNAPFTQVVHASGNMKKFQIITGGLTCLNLPFSWLCLVLGASPISVFVVSIVLGLCTQLACVFVVNDFFKYGIGIYLREVILPCLKITAIAPIIPVLLLVVIDHRILNFIVVVIGSVVSTIISIYLLALSSSEKSTLKRIITEKINK